MRPGAPARLRAWQGCNLINPPAGSCMKATAWWSRSVAKTQRRSNVASWRPCPLSWIVAQASMSGPTRASASSEGMVKWLACSSRLPRTGKVTGGEGDMEQSHTRRA